MLRRIATAGLAVATLFVAAPRTAFAQDSLIGVHVGGFIPKGLDGRSINDDVLRATADFFTYDCAKEDPIGCFNGFFISGEYLYGIGDFLEAGVSVGYYQKKVPGFYSDFTDTDGSDINFDTTFKDVPVAVTLRAFPIGRTTPVQPYVGGGVVFHRWGYKEEGEFIDFTPGGNMPIFRDVYDDKGTAVGPTILGGVRIPVAQDRFMVGGEVRWQGGKADLNPDFTFAADQLELGGITAVAGFHVRF